MKKTAYYFFGVNVAKDRMVGYIESSDIIRGFDQSWMPAYQRDRILKPKKVNALTKIFQTGAPIDSVKLNLIGNADVTGEEAILEGTFHVIDGQQRLWSLKESGVANYRMPVELYLNLPYDREVELFHQYNTAATKLTFGELAKSCSGPMADSLRATLNNKKYPVPLSVNSPKLGVTLSVFAAVLHWCHRKLIMGERRTSVNSGRGLRSFLEESYEPKEIQTVEFAVRNLFELHVKTFGNFDVRAMAYRRGFMLAWFQVIVDNFLQPTGKIDFGAFKDKAKSIPHIFNNAAFREVVTKTSGDSLEFIYDMIIEHMNWRKKGQKLLKMRERPEEHLDPEEVVGQVG